MGLVSDIGRRVSAGCESCVASVAFVGETVVSAFGTLAHPRRFRFGDFALLFQRAAFDGLPVATGIGFLLGLILAFESASALRMFGVEIYVSDLLTIGLFRELGPLVTAIVLAGRSGSAFAAEIGTMRVNEELDALRTMGLPPVRFLVLPRVCAAVCAMPALTVFAELAGLLGGALVLKTMGVPTTVFWRHVIETATSGMIAGGLIKAAFFGLLVGLIGCFSGMRAKASADAVGTAATSAVVGGIVSVAVADGLLAVLCYLWGV